MTAQPTRNGLRQDPEKWRQTQQRAVVKAQQKRRATVEQRTEGKRVVVRRRPRGGGDWSTEVRVLARLRSGGICELCQTAPADHLHHRQSRRNKDHRIVNALHVCFHCHEQIHAGPKRAAKCGWIVHSLANAADVPVVLVGRRLLLTVDGGYRDFKTGEAA